MRLLRLMLPVAMIATSAIAAACADSSAPRAEIPCPRPGGEFPPTECAFLIAQAVTTTGAAITDMAMRVDSFFPRLGYAYEGGTATTDGLGRFQLVVYRWNHVGPEFVPDTATLNVAIYDLPIVWSPLHPRAIVPVQLHFHPLGHVADTAQLRLTFDLR